MKIAYLKSSLIRSIFIHSLIWCFFILASLLQFYQSPFILGIDFYAQWATAILLFYINYIYLVPKLLLQKSYLTYFLFLFGIILLFVAIRNYYFPPEFKHLEIRTSIPTSTAKKGIVVDFNKRPMPFLPRILPSFFYLLITAISITIKTLSEYYKNQKNRLIGETQKKTTELIYLRKQTNPHFLFNSLNSLYSLAYKKSDLLPDAIVTLSELMRYMLYETDHDVVSLEKELKYISNYIELQKLRLNDIENIKINIHGDTKDKFIEPLLLIVFVENAFKYGTDYKGSTWVKILIEIRDNQLDFWIENKIGNHPKDEENSGIGIKNIESRLELLYPNSHELDITTEDEKYKLHLVLKLDGIKI